jgi:Zn-dependent protease with chaperone function
LFLQAKFARIREKEADRRAFNTVQGYSMKTDALLADLRGGRELSAGNQLLLTVRLHLKAAPNIERSCTITITINAMPRHVTEKAN